MEAKIAQVASNDRPPHPLGVGVGTSRRETVRVRKPSTKGSVSACTRVRLRVRDKKTRAGA